MLKVYVPSNVVFIVPILIYLKENDLYKKDKYIRYLPLPLLFLTATEILSVTMLFILMVSIGEENIALVFFTEVFGVYISM